VASYKDGYQVTGGPLVAKGKVMIGTKGPNVPGGNYIVGLDAKTGDESWRVSTIPKPGEPGGNSWNGLPIEKRSGASVWVPGSYDPEVNLAFFGVAQTYDTAPLRQLVQDGSGASHKNVFKSFKPLEASLTAALEVENAILDGELVCLDSKGRSDFNGLMRRRSKPVYYAFDLIWLNNVDLRKLPLIERKRRLRELIPQDNPHLLFANYIETKGKDLFQIVCAQDLEGIVAKRKNSPYSKRGWVKIKNPTHSQREGRKGMFDSNRKRG
jgi:ATP dependent DNA ligase domain